MKKLKNINTNEIVSLLKFKDNKKKTEYLIKLI